MIISRRRSTVIRLGRFLLCLGLLTHGWDIGAQEKSLLWKLEAGKNTVYLLGSIHLLKKDTVSSKPIIDEVFSKAKRLVFEIDIPKETPEKTQKLLMQKGVNLDGKTLIVMQLQKLGYDPSFGIDRQLAQRAQQANKPISGLETAEYQFDQLDRLSPAMQELMLRQSFDEMEQLGKTVDEMVLAWRTGDVASAEKLLLESMTDYPEIREKLLDERNRNWLPKIDQFLKLDEDVLVVVGAAHLLGKNGVIELLKSRGYKMEQM